MEQLEFSIFNSTEENRIRKPDLNAKIELTEEEKEVLRRKLRFPPKKSSPPINVVIGEDDMRNALISLYTRRKLTSQTSLTKLRKWGRTITEYLVGRVYFKKERKLKNKSYIGIKELYFATFGQNPHSEGRY